MTLTYNSSVRSMQKYISENLIKVNDKDDKCDMYTDNIKNKGRYVRSKDIFLLVTNIKYIVDNDFEKIKKVD